MQMFPIFWKWLYLQSVFCSTKYSLAVAAIFPRYYCNCFPALMLLWLVRVWVCCCAAQMMHSNMKMADAMATTTKVSLTASHCSILYLVPEKAVRTKLRSVPKGRRGNGVIPPFLGRWNGYRDRRKSELIQSNISGASMKMKRKFLTYFVLRCFNT